MPVPELLLPGVLDCSSGWRALTLPPVRWQLAFVVGINADSTRLILFAWALQFEEAIAFEGVDFFSRLTFLLSLPWKSICAFAPPPRMLGGWACFVVVLAFIGALTALIGDVAAHMGCCLGLQPSITAITFVALGTSLPDTFASMSAATSEEHADSSIGNITGSNSVNVFLGLGLPWAIAAVYWSFVAPGTDAETQWHARYRSEPWYVPGESTVGFAVPAGSLGFSVGVFSVCAIVCLGILMLRRAACGYELGYAYTRPTAVCFVLLWFVYIAASVAQSGHGHGPPGLPTPSLELASGL